MMMENSPEQNTREEEQPRKGGLRTMPFIIVNESFEKVASYGLMPNMIFYMLNDYHMGLADGTTILLLWGALSSGLAIVGAFLSDSYWGRFRIIVLGSFSSLLGMVLLWLTTMIPELKPPPCIPYSSSCHPANPAQLTFFVFSMFLISIGAGCIRPCAMAFGADQLNNKNNPNNERLLETFFNWYYASTGLATTLAFTAIIYIQVQWGWKVGFGVPAILMAFSVVMFLLGSHLYKNVDADKSLLSGLFQVPVAAFRKGTVVLPAPNLRYHHGRNSSLTAPTMKLRYLNKACIISDPQGDLNPDGSASSPWKLCTVEQVELLKTMIKVIPICSSGIMVVISLNQQAFAIIQASRMDRHLTSNFQIPAGSFTVFSVLTMTIYVIAYDRFFVPILIKLTGNQSGLTTKTRMRIGLVVSTVATAVSAVVEIKRRRTAIDEGLVNKPEGVTSMSAMWLIPQNCLLGLAEAMNAVGQIEFYYSQFPKSLSSIGVGLFTLSTAVASLVAALLVRIVDETTGKGEKVSWLSSNINKGHLDYFYWLLTALGVVNFGYYYLCCWGYGPMDTKTSVWDEKGDNEETT